MSDEGIENALYDSHAIRHFVGIDLAKNTAQLMTLFGLANLMIAKGRLLQLNTQGAS